MYHVDGANEHVGPDFGSPARPNERTGLIYIFTPVMLDHMCEIKNLVFSVSVVIELPFKKSIDTLKCVNTVSLRLCLEYCQSCQSCQFDQLVALYFETNTFNLKI